MIRLFAWPTLRLSRSVAPLAACLAVPFALVACGPGGANGSPSSIGRLKVVTTTTVFADIVRNVGGDRVAVSSIIPPGVGPEDFEPKPADAKLLSDAKLVVSNGVGLDDFLDGLLASGSGGTTPRLVLGVGIPTLTENGEQNPHFWLDPSLVNQYYVPRIAAKLAEIDPTGKATFDANATAYAASIAALDEELKADVEAIPPANRKLVTFHDAFPYFARHFGFELVGVILQNPGQEPTAAELAALIDRVKSTGVKAVFSEAQFNPSLSETLAREAGIRRVVTTLYTDSLGPSPADSYLGLMRWDVDQIVAALR
jgi:zinc/manganese transport system substrate-binding protein/manganese/iron transport system substrate-binding protein